MKKGNMIYVGTSMKEARANKTFEKDMEKAMKLALKLAIKHKQHINMYDSSGNCIGCYEPTVENSGERISVRAFILQEGNRWKDQMVYSGSIDGKNPDATADANNEQQQGAVEENSGDANSSTTDASEDTAEEQVSGCGNCGGACGKEESESAESWELSLGITDNIALNPQMVVSIRNKSGIAYTNFGLLPLSAAFSLVSKNGDKAKGVFVKAGKTSALCYEGNQVSKVRLQKKQKVKLCDVDLTFNI